MSEIGYNFLHNTTNDWIIWLKSQARKEDVPDILPLEDLTLDEQLIIAYKELKKDNVKLVKAVKAVLFEFSETRQFPEVTYCLLLFIGRIRPEEYAIELEILLKSGSLQGVFYDKINLEYLLVNEILNFQNIENYKEYFYRIIYSHDFQLALIGLKYFYKHEPPHEYFSYLTRMLLECNFENIDSDYLAAYVIDSLVDFEFYRNNFKEIHSWVNYIWPILAERSFDFFEKINTEFLRWLHPGNPKLFIEKNLDAISIRAICENALIEIANLRSQGILNKPFKQSSSIKSSDNSDLLKNIISKVNVIIKDKSMDLNEKYDVYLDEVDDFNRYVFNNPGFASLLKAELIEEFENEYYE